MIVVKEHSCVVFLTIDAGDIYHGEVHADVSDDWSRLAIDPETGVAVAKLSAQSVGVTYRNHRYS